MSRKKRRFEQLEAAASKPKEKISYRDPFQEKVGSRVEEIGKRFEGQGRNVLYMVAAIAELRVMAAADSPVGKLSKYALAQALASDGKYDEAVPMFQELAAMNDPIVAAETVKFDLASAYEKQDRKQEAADLYFDIAKNA